jgi:hypothetical protein
MRTLVQLAVCVVIAWGVIAVLWPQIWEASRKPLWRN